MGAKSSKLLQEAQEKGTSTVNLSNLKLKVIGPEIEYLKDNLTRLSLSQNSLTYLPFEVSKLLKLRYVNLSKNKFEVFPTVLCELPVLEVIDISHNKIKLLPSKFCRSLKVLCISYNKISVLPSSIVQCTNLVKLEMDGNPIVFPPKSVIKRQKEVSDEEWLTELREFLVLHDASLKIKPPKKEKEKSEFDKEPVPLSKLLSDQEEAKRLIRKKHEEELRQLGEEHASQIRRMSSQKFADSKELEMTPALNILQETSRLSSEENVKKDDFEEICNRYFRQSNVEKLPQNERIMIQACKSVLYANLQIWKAMKQALQASSNRNLTRILWRVQSENAEKMKMLVRKLELCEYQRRSQMTSLKDIQKSGLNLTLSLRRLIKSFVPLLPVLAKTTDLRITKNLLNTWSSSVADIYEAVEVLVHLSDGNLEGEYEEPQSAIFRAAYEAYQVVEQLIRVLGDFNKSNQDINPHPNPKFTQTLNGLHKMILQTETDLNRLYKSLESWDDGTEDLETFYYICGAFIQSSIKTSAVARLVSEEYKFGHEVVQLIEEVMQATKFLGTFLPNDKKRTLGEKRHSVESLLEMQDRESRSQSFL